MMRLAWRAVELLLVPTIALAAAVLVQPHRTALWVHVWLLVVLAIAFVVCVGAVRRAYPATGSPFEVTLRPRPVTITRPAGLASLEREVSSATWSSYDLLRPTLVTLSGDLLRSLRGVDPRRSPDEARAILGDEVWELVRPDRPRTERYAPGVLSGDVLDRVVTALERI